MVCLAVLDFMVDIMGGMEEIMELDLMGIFILVFIFWHMVLDLIFDIMIGLVRLLMVGMTVLTRMVDRGFIVIFP